MFISTDDHEKADAEPDDKYLRVFKVKLRELAHILADVYPPSESFRFNEKLANMGRISVFVSFPIAIRSILYLCKLNSHSFKFNELKSTSFISLWSLSKCLDP